MRIQPRVRFLVFFLLLLAPDVRGETFGASREAEFSLPVSYETVRAALINFLDLYPTLLARRSVIETTNLACRYSGTSETLKYYDFGKDWPNLGVLAMTFYDGAQIVEGDPDYPELKSRLREAVLRIADQVIALALDDAPNFRISYNPNTSPVTVSYGGETLLPLGWNNLASRWDGFSNRTCTSPAVPNLYASAWALTTIALAHRLAPPAQLEKYRRAFYRGALYWHAYSGSGSYFLNNEYPAQTNRHPSYYGIFYGDGQIGSAVAFSKPNILDLLGKNAAWNRNHFTVQPLYTSGGSRFRSLSGRQVLRYHFHFDDPGLYAMNVTANMALTMLTAAGTMPEFRFSIAQADGTGALTPLRLSFREIGTDAISSVYGNYRNCFSAANLSYSDCDSVSLHPSFGRYPFDTHTDYTHFFLARSGAASGDGRLGSAVAGAFGREKRQADAWWGALTPEQRDLPRNRSKWDTFRYGSCLSRQIASEALGVCSAYFRERRITSTSLLFLAVTNTAKFR